NRPKTCTELFEDFRYDYGSINERCLYRYLKYLISVGCVTPEGKSGSRIYTKKSSQLPRRRRIINRCSICGIERTNSKAHPDHKLARSMVAKSSRPKIRRLLQNATGNTDRLPSSGPATGNKQRPDIRAA